MNYPDPKICAGVCQLWRDLVYHDGQHDMVVHLLKSFVPVRVSLPAEPQNPRLG